MSPHLGNQVAQSLPEILNLSGFRRRGHIPVADTGGASMGNLNPAFFRQRPVGFGNRIEVDPQVDRQTAHRGQHIPGAQDAFYRARPNLIYDLPVNRRGRCEINPNLWRGRHLCMLYIYTIQTKASVSSLRVQAI